MEAAEVQLAGKNLFILRLSLLDADPDRRRRDSVNPFTPTIDFIEEKVCALPRGAISF
jgi:hypothetical protein